MNPPAERFRPHRCGRYIGRVGALALFLGVGAAVTPAVASADTARSPSHSSAAHASASAHSAKSAAVQGHSARSRAQTNNTVTASGTASVRRAAKTTPAGKADPLGVPRLPSPEVVLSAATQWLRRQATATLFNTTPTTAYDPTQNSESDTGVVSGNLNAVDAEGDRISYVITSAPQQGSVAINPDGTFAYVPDDDLATAGGTDSFTVRVSDRAGNPLHVNLANMINPDPSSGRTQVDVTVDPTATPPSDQVQMEALAMQIASSRQMQFAKNILRPVWLTLGVLKYLPAGGLSATNIARLNQDLDEFTFGVAMRVVNTDPYRPEILTYEIPPHNWGLFDVPGGRWAYDNPDSIYRTIPVKANSSYVITGRFVGDPPKDLNFSVYTNADVTNSVDNIGIHDLVVNPDGTFTITVNSSLDDGQPNHLHLTSDAQLVFIRDTLGDWTASPVELSVERVEGPDAPPAKSYARLVKGATEMMLNSGIGLYSLMLLPFIQPVNSLGKPTHTFGTLATQRQSSTLFHLSDDQAMVVTVTLGDAGYFTAPVTDAWTITPDYWNHQSSLNSSQAIPNADGSYTLVISNTDPGVANWVDTAGLNQGSLFVRWQLPGTNPDAGAPTVTSRVVRLEDLPSVLPADTVSVTPEKRAEQLADRQQAYESRFARFLTI
ncbi:Ig-like domain-containing protein [Mycobacterium sp. CVI_P3]|uniref:Ig-like domain-containing protein n=1 Tax=Mycobacterium pinniadriaticum TaxID=2994102 RepID=A0ABT3SGB1_9MYCO|nr:Ig-like domain-containing protein [Mycobacterium pinniadriaticum]MCX2932125.1 Ig-like domain-containing protein [Mycobacterium pinniadriaticum]MCX2938549.1 Ig-like domain-containing protein [Mycobacterium pinniadriaticum]